VALREDGSVWAWGDNTDGQLGDGSTVLFNSTPVRVDRHVAGATAVAAGHTHSVALGADKTVWTWGANSSGELGDGTAGPGAHVPVHLGLTGVTQITAGVHNSLAVLSDGTLWAWGENSHGQQGNGTINTSARTPTQVPGLTGVVQASANFFTVLAIASPPPTAPPTTPPPPVPQPVAVPNLIGQAQNQAGSILQSANLVLGITGTRPDDRSCNHLFDVVGQDPAAGTLVAPGSSVNITIAVAPDLPCF
jgi:hypothetical protein